MSSKSSVTPSIAFVDLATFDELHAYLYGGDKAVTYFVKSVRKANWFSFVPISLRHVSGNANFNEEFSASVNRSGDYVLNTWLRVKVPLLKLKTLDNGERIRWTRNFMHNLVKKVSITFNELTVHEFDSAWFDFNHYFRTRGSKLVGYQNMIGDISAMTDFISFGETLGTGGHFNLPLPLFYGEDSGVALGVAALPFNDIKINYTLRNWDDLLVTDGNGVTSRTDVLADVYDTDGNKPSLSDVQTLAHYAVVHNDERVLMGKAPRDIHIHQVQSLNESTFAVTAANTPTAVDLRFSHAVHFMVWAARNTTVIGEWSNYSIYENGTVDTGNIQGGADPIAQTLLIYENTNRADLGADYYSTVVPWYWCDAIPQITGLHAYSYSLEAFGMDPKGSTGYSKLANVSLSMNPSTDATSATTLTSTVHGTSAQTLAGLGTIANSAQTYKYQIKVRNSNIVRMSGGSLGLPIL